MSCPDPCALVAPEPCRALVDYIMMIGNTKVGFVAKLLATLRVWGPEFTPADIHQAEIRAASTLAQTALIRGQSLQFMRLAVPWDEPTAATFLGVTVPELQAFEAETTVMPPSIWLALADYVAKLDGRSHYDIPPPCPPENWQPRVIRVWPDFPTPSSQTFPAPGCTPC